MCSKKGNSHSDRGRRYLSVLVLPTFNTITSFYCSRLNLPPPDPIVAVVLAFSVLTTPTRNKKCRCCIFYCIFSDSLPKSTINKSTSPLAHDYTRRNKYKSYLLPSCHAFLYTVQALSFWRPSLLRRAQAKCCQVLRP
jgi:hypothetical protein